MPDGAGGSTLASAYVRINPDLEYFKEQLEAGVESAVDSTNADVKVGADTAEADERVAALAAELQALDAEHPEVTPGVETTDAQSKLDALSASLDEYDTQHPEATAGLEDTDAQTKLAALQADLDEYDATHADATLGVSDGDTEAKIVAAQALVDTYGETHSDATLGARDNATPTFESLQAKVDALTLRQARISVVIDDAGDEAVLQNLSDKLAELTDTVHEVTVTTDTAAVDAQLDALEARYAKLEGEVVETNLRADMSDASAKITAAGALLDAYGARSPTATLKADDSDVTAKVTAAGAALAAIGATDTTTEIRANDQASPRLAAVQSLLSALQGRLATAQVKADDQASGPVAQVQNALSALTAHAYKPSVTTDVADTRAKLAAVEADLSELSARVAKPNLDTSDIASAEVDVRELAQALAGLGGGGGSGGVGGDFGWLDTFSEDAGEASEGAGELGSSIEVAIAAVAALAPVVGVAGGALATLPAIFGSTVSAAGALYLGLEPLIDVLKDYEQAEAQSTNQQAALALSALQTSQQLSSAQDAVTQARVSLSQAQVSAANNVHSAEENVVSSEQALADAQFNETQAQEALTQARQDAEFALENYKNQLADAKLQEQADLLAIQQAREALTSTELDPSSTALQKQQAQLAYQQAVQQLQDQKTQTAQLSTEASEAAKQGVNNATTVVQAEHGVTDAKNATAQAQQKVTDSQNAYKQAVTAAAQTVQEAQRELSQAEQAQRVAQAEIASGANSSSSAIETYTKAFGKLTPAGQDFVKYVESNILPAFHGLQADAETGLAPGLEKSLKNLAPWFSQLGPEITQTATGISNFFASITGWAGSKSGLEEISKLFKSGEEFGQDIGTALEVLTPAFTTLGDQAAPIVDALGNGIDNLADAFANWVSDGGFEHFVDWLRENGPTVVSTLGGIVKTIANVAVDLAPAGLALDTVLNDGLLPGITALGELARGWEQLEETLLHFIGGGKSWEAFFEDIGSAVRNFYDNDWSPTFERVGNSLEGVWNDVDKYFINPLESAWDDIETDFVDPIGNFFDSTLPSYAEDLVGWASDLETPFQDAWKDIEKYFVDPIEGFFTTDLENSAQTGLAFITHLFEQGFADALNPIIRIYDDTLGKIPGFPTISQIDVNQLTGQKQQVPPSDNEGPQSGAAQRHDLNDTDTAALTASKDLQLVIDVDKALSSKDVVQQLQSIMNQFDLSYPQLQSIVGEYGVALPNSLAANKTQTQNAASNAALAAVAGLKGHTTDAGNAGNAVGQSFDDGIVEGLKDHLKVIEHQAGDTTEVLIVAGKAAIHASSPSKDSAEQIALPWIQGIENELISGKDTLARAAETALSALFETQLEADLRQSKAASAQLADYVSGGAAPASPITQNVTIHAPVTVTAPAGANAQDVAVLVDKAITKSWEQRLTDLNQLL